MDEVDSIFLDSQKSAPELGSKASRLIGGHQTKCDGISASVHVATSRQHGALVPSSVRVVATGRACRRARGVPSASATPAHARRGRLGPDVVFSASVPRRPRVHLRARPDRWSRPDRGRHRHAPGLAGFSYATRSPFFWGLPPLGRERTCWVARPHPAIPSPSLPRLFFPCREPGERRSMGLLELIWTDEISGGFEFEKSCVSCEFWRSTHTQSQKRDQQRASVGIIRGHKPG